MASGLKANLEEPIKYFSSDIAFEKYHYPNAISKISNLAGVLKKKV